MRYRMSERSALKPIQLMNLSHMPQAVLSAHMQEADNPFTIPCHAELYLCTVMSLWGCVS